MASENDVVRRDSAAYWNADAWDPDDRVYVGASIGETSYREAVQPEAGETRQIAQDCRGNTEASGELAESQGPGFTVAAEAPEESVGPAPKEASKGRLARGASEDFWDALGTNPRAASTYSNSTVLCPATVTVPGSGLPGLGLGDGSSISPTSPGSDGSFWDKQGAMSSGLGMPGPGPAAGRKDLRGTAEDGEEEAKALRPPLPRVNSGAYWDADQWDPDQRVYVGADAGQTNHLIAVDLEAEAQANLILRVWKGGLASTSLGLGDKAGPPVDLSCLPEGRPKLTDLYELNETLGAGSFGAVRSGRHRATGQKCAVKVLGKSLSGERFRRSLVDKCMGERALQLTQEAPHENVARCFDMLEGPNHWYHVMEELTGPELMQQLEEQFPVTEAYVQNVMPQVLKALAHIHSPPCEVVHRDVKLSNFKFRSPEATAPLVLLDFGFACSLKEEWDGAHCGTMMFLAPEVLSSSARLPHLAAMDMWSAGVILYLLFTGDSPLQEADMALFAKSETAQKASEVLSKALDVRELQLISREAYDLLRRLLVIDPAERLTAQEALSHGYWSGSPGAERCERQLPVSSKTFDRVRSAASRSSKSIARLSSRKNMNLEDIDVGLERIVSDGEREDLEGQ